MTVGFTSLDDLPLEQVTPGYSRRNLVGEKEMVSWAFMKAGTHAAAHQHPHEQVFWILAGAMDFRLGTEHRTVHKGDLVLVPPNMEHECVCLEDTEFVTMLAPPRADLLYGAPVPDHLQANA
jgi:quercetin dioxygenase-like cupin family protein